jgi:DNA ligase-4
MTINEVNDFLDELYLAGEAKEKSTCLTKLIKNGSLLEQKWIIHIILKDLKIGIGHETVLKLFQPKSLDVYNSTSSLIEVCNFIQNPQNPKFAENFYRVNLPIKPMLASRMTLHEIIDNFMSVPTIVETKYDGERIQCHIKDGQIRLFTRNAVDYTDLYGPKLSSYLSQAIKAKCAILDGEVVVWDKINNKFSAFGENKTVALKNRNKNYFLEEAEDDKELIYMVFDIIYLVTPSGQELSLQEVILKDRKEILKKVVRTIPNKIVVVEGSRCDNIEEIFSHFNHSIENQEEGIIIKKLESTYKLDDRTRDWVKVKCDYIDSLVDTLDLAIIGGYYGEGKRVGRINGDSSDCITTFLMGVVKKYDKENPRNSVVLPFVKVGTGYTIQQLETIRSWMKGLWKKYDTRLPPKLFGNWTPAIKERPDVYVEDVSSTIILELKAAEITASDTFATKLTLRFPRVLNVRFDKGIEDAMKYEEVLEFYQSFQHNFLMKKKRKVEENGTELNETGAAKEAKQGGRKVKYSGVIDDFKDTETNNVS